MGLASFPELIYAVYTYITRHLAAKCDVIFLEFKPFSSKVRIFSPPYSERTQVLTRGLLLIKLLQASNRRPSRLSFMSLKSEKRREQCCQPNRCGHFVKLKNIGKAENHDHRYFCQFHFRNSRPYRLYCLLAIKST